MLIHQLKRVSSFRGWRGWWWSVLGLRLVDAGPGWLAGCVSKIKNYRPAGSCAAAALLRCCCAAAALLLRCCCAADASLLAISRAVESLNSKVSYFSLITIISLFGYALYSGHEIGQDDTLHNGIYYRLPT